MRTYEDGRSTGDWTQGDRIASMNDLMVGDIVYMISHSFESDNLIKIVDRCSAHPNSFYAVFLNEELLINGSRFLLWNYDFNNNNLELHKVIK